jgi:glycosyltransferase involved in cell wall biosynthesis
MIRDFEESQFVFVSSRTGKVMGRVERRLLRVMAALLDRRAGVHLICAPRSPLEEAARSAGVDVAPYHLDKLNVARTRSRIRKYLERHRPVAIHSMGYDADMLARYAAKGLPTAAVNTITCASWPRKGFTRRLLDSRSIKNVDMFVCDCRSLTRRLADAGIPAEKLMIDPPSIDIPAVISQSEQTIDIPDVHGTMIGYGGRIEESRGLEELVAASAILDARGVLAQVVIAGEGPLLKSLQQEVRSSRVKYLGWVDSVPAVVKRFEVAVFPSTAAGVPTSMLEAAVLGVPIVASRVAGIEEMFEDGSEVRLVEPGDSRALAAAIADVVAHPEEASEMARAAQTRTVDEYSALASIDRHMELYKEFMKR